MNERGEITRGVSRPGQTPMDSGDEPRTRFPRPARRREGTALLPFARPELAAEMEQWLEHLGAERRYSPRTLEAYARDVRQLLAFLAEHLGKKISLADLKQLEPRDIRAFLAERRAQGLTGRS